MPLPPANSQNLIINDWQGIDIERNVQARPENSFKDLVNFDLVKPGVIRKIRGTKRLTVEALTSPIVGFRDFQAVPGAPEFLVVVSASGKLYLSNMNADPIVLTLIGNLYSPVSLMDEAPFIVSLPMFFEGENRQAVVITLGTKNDVQKWNGAGVLQSDITRLGIDNPGDLFTVDFQHSLALPQFIYHDGTLGADIYLNTAPTDDLGVPIVTGRQYRASWYNPDTKHDSSLFPLHFGDCLTDFNIPQDTSKTKPFGILQTKDPARFVMAAPMFFDNLPQRTPAEPFPAPQVGYNNFRIWATQDGGTEFFLVPILYDQYGRIITDEDSSIRIQETNWGFFEVTSGVTSPDKPIYDGFVPLGVPLFAGTFWTAPFLYTDTADYVANGAAAIGSDNINVTKTGGRIVTRSRFVLPGDSTIYSILNTTGVGPNYNWEIDPPLQKALAGAAQITLLFTKPTPDVALITPWRNSTESPFDRINDPPPKASWGVVYQNRLMLLDANDKTRLVYSRIGDYESFPPNNEFKFTQADFDPITALLAGRQVGLVSEGADQRLIVAKQQATYQITGTSILDFALTGLFPETGIVNKRAAIVIGGYTVAISKEGIQIIEMQRPVFVGSRIKDLIDRAHYEEYGPCFALDRRDNQVLMGMDFFAVPAPPAAQITKIITMRPPRAGGNDFLSPFSTINALPDTMAIIQESGFGVDVRMLMAGQDGHIYQLFTGGDVVDSDGNTSPLVATAITQELPQKDRDKRKVFHLCRFDGEGINEDNGWQISFSADGGITYTPEVQMYNENLIGIASKTLVIKIRHNRSVGELESLPQISNMSLYYTTIGDAR